ncbi:DUF3857 domain-containing protein [Dyadobacter bucti]|uniref:DUF3857 domain-containing protein n=1 Tax=Dyadobacter bucti TaxID=2572203 RepID=UPI001107EBBE|nr:DUF3857 domain-containing protein [Dyadobacter bucti]
MTITSTFVKVRWIVFLAFVFAVTRAFAVPAIQISPAPSWVVPVIPGGKAPSLKEFSGGYYLSFSDTQVNLDKKTTYERFIRQIVNESGIQNGSEVSVTFDPMYENLTFHNIIIWRNGQAIPQLNRSNFNILPLETDRQRFIYNGYYSASVILKDIRKGDRIEVSFSRKGWNPVFQNKYSRNLSFYTYDYTSHIHYAIIAKKGREILFKDFNKPPVKTIKVTQEGEAHEWDLKNVKNIPYDDNVPFWYNKQPFVQVTEYKSWKEVVDWGLNFYQVPAITGALKDKVDEWKKSSISTIQFIETAVRFVQDDIRYMGIETGENSHRPHDPASVFKQRYGDCKDKAFLLCAILKANDIECDPLLVDTYKRASLSDYLPSPNNFNHVVVRMRLRDEGPYLNAQDAIIFVDATISLQGGALSKLNFPPYGQGLLLKKGQKRPIALPIQNPGYLTVTEDIYLPEEGDTAANGRVEVKTIYFEGQADDFRSFFQQSVISETEESYLNYYRDTYKHAEFELSDTLEFYDQREASNFSLFERYTMKNAWQYDSTRKKYYFNILGKILYDQLTILPNRKRKDPVFLKYPYHNTYTIRVHTGGTRLVPHDSWNIERAAYLIHFKSEFLNDENVWELTYEYETRQDHVPVALAGQFRSDMEKLADNLNYQLTTADLGDISKSNVNWGTVIFSLLTVCGSAFFFRRLYRYSPLAGQENEPAIPIGGWVALIGISIALQPFVILFTMLNQSGSIYYTKSGWDVLNDRSGMMILGYRVLLLFEMFFNVMMVCFSVLLNFLFFKKRDSFPMLYSVYMGGNLLFVIADTAAAYFLYGVSGNNYDSQLNQVFRQIIQSAIWIPYLNKSVRVRQTFVNTFESARVLEPSSEE